MKDPHEEELTRDAEGCASIVALMMILATVLILGHYVAAFKLPELSLWRNPLAVVPLYVMLALVASAIIHETSAGEIADEDLDEDEEWEATR